ncbi:MAG: prolipoprotein diacylglyceryl transferase [Anaerolineae bacterium]|nr:prolipoprotein diacylglyceryl transferase [Anaerolineae bacterium]
MPTTITFGPLTVETFTALVAAAALLGLAVVTGTARRPGDSRLLPGLDVGLGGVVGGVIGARLLHVLLWWPYFRDHLSEVFKLGAGGLSWHGALYGGLIGLWLAARWQSTQRRAVSLRPVRDALALAWPLGLMAGWGACWAAACGYGAEVWTLADFPTWAVSEAPDVFGFVAPRYNTQLFGVGFGAALLLVIGLLTLSGRLRDYRLWLALLLTGTGMFVLGFWRGDGLAGPLPGLTWDQVLDLSVIAVSAGFIVAERITAARHS